VNTGGKLWPYHVEESRKISVKFEDLQHHHHRHRHRRRRRRQPQQQQQQYSADIQHTVGE